MLAVLQHIKQEQQQDLHQQQKTQLLQVHQLQVVMLYLDVVVSSTEV